VYQGWRRVPEAYESVYPEGRDAFVAYEELQTPPLPVQASTPQEPTPPPPLGPFDHVNRSYIWEESHPNHERYRQEKDAYIRDSTNVRFEPLLQYFASDPNLEALVTEYERQKAWEPQHPQHRYYLQARDYRIRRGEVAYRESIYREDDFERDFTTDLGYPAEEARIQEIQRRGREADRAAGRLPPPSPPRRTPQQQEEEERHLTQIAARYREAPPPILDLTPLTPIPEASTTSPETPQ